MTMPFIFAIGVTLFITLHSAQRIEDLEKLQEEQIEKLINKKYDELDEKYENELNKMSATIDKLALEKRKLEYQLEEYNDKIKNCNGCSNYMKEY